MKRALITGVTGQDGSYLAELLLEKGFNEYKPTQFDSPSCDECWQKCYKDETGKKYFLENTIIDYF